MDRGNIKQWVFIAAALIAASCDSGNIYPEDDLYDEGITVEGSFTLLSQEAYPSSGYSFIFGVFAEGGDIPLASVNVARPAEGQPLSVKLENIPEEATSAKLCFANAGRQVVYTFFEYAVDGSGAANIVIPSAQVDLLEYDRIQKLVFEQYNCVSCHGGTTGAGNLLLTAGYSYSRLVNAPAAKSAKNRATPGDTGNSFLLDVLAENGALATPHTGFVTRQTDLDLLRIWIEAGCPDN